MQLGMNQTENEEVVIFDTKFCERIIDHHDDNVNQDQQGVISYNYNNIVKLAHKTLLSRNPMHMEKIVFLMNATRTVWQTVVVYPAHNRIELLDPTNGYQNDAKKNLQVVFRFLYDHVWFYFNDTVWKHFSDFKPNLGWTILRLPRCFIFENERE